VSLTLTSPLVLVHGMSDHATHTNAGLSRSPDPPSLWVEEMRRRAGNTHDWRFSQQHLRAQFMKNGYTLHFESKRFPEVEAMVAIESSEVSAGVLLITAARRQGQRETRICQQLLTRSCTTRVSGAGAYPHRFLTLKSNSRQKPGTRYTTHELNSSVRLN
jgi:hypothetical protein